MDVKHHDRKKDVGDLALVNVVGWGWRSRRVVVVVVVGWVGCLHRHNLCGIVGLQECNHTSAEDGVEFAPS